MPVVLNTEQRNQLDRNIKMMLANGASEVDVKSYASDFKNKYAVEKKSKVGGSFPLLSNGVDLKDMDDIKAFVTGKPVEEIKAAKEANKKPPAKISTPVLTQVTSQKPSDESIAELANKKIQSIADEDLTDPIKGINKLSQVNPTNTKDILATEKAKKLLMDKMVADGFDAKEILNRSFFGGTGDDNQTSRILREKAADYDKSVAALRDIPVETDLSQANDEYLDYNYKDRLYSAAVQWKAQADPNFKKELEVTGVNPVDWVNVRNQLGSGKAGNIMAEYLSDPNVRTYLQKENPNLIPAFLKVEKDLLKDNRDFAINQVANKVSKAVQETGYNNIDPIVNYYGEGHKQFADQVAQSTLTPEELEVWNRDIKNNQEQYMDAPSLMQGIAEGGEGVFKGIANTFTEPFRSASESTKKRWEKEASHVSADPEGVFKVLRDTGHVLGLVGAIAGTGNVLGGGGAGLYSSKLVPALSGGVLPFLGDSLEEGRSKYPDSPVKAWTSALFNTAMYTALSQQLFPAKNINQAIGKVKPEMNNIIERLSNGSISREAARQEANTAFKKGLDFIAGATGKAGKITGELTAIKEFNKRLDQIMMDEDSFEKTHPAKDETKEALGLFLSNLALGGLSKYGEMKKRNRVAEESYYALASNPKKFERMIDNLSIDKSFGTIQEFKANLKYIAEVKKEMDALKINPKEQKRFIFESLKEKAAKEAAEKSTDPTIQKQNKEVAKHSAEVKEKILAGEDADKIITESEQKELDKQQETAIQIERLQKDNELDNKKFDAQRKGLDGRNPDDKLKIEEIEEKRKRANEDYERELSKLKPPTEEESFLKELKSKAGEFEKGENLQYFIDKAGEAPVQYIAKYGDKITNELLSQVPTDKLKKNLDDLLNIDADNPNVKKLDELIEQRESAIASEPLEKPKEGAAENVVPSTLKEGGASTGLSRGDVEGEFVEKIEPKIEGEPNLVSDMNKGEKLGSLYEAKKYGSPNEIHRKLLDAGYKEVDFNDKSYDEIIGILDNEIKKGFQPILVDKQNGKINSVYDWRRNTAFTDNMPYSVLLRPENIKDQSISPNIEPENKNISSPINTQTGKQEGKATGEEAGVGEPPIKPSIVEGEVSEGIGITHAQTGEIRKEFNLPEYEKKASAFPEWDAEAAERIKKGDLPKLLDKMNKGDEISSVEQRMMGMYIAHLDRKVAADPSDANLAELKNAVELSDRVGGSQIGKSLVARKGTFLPEDSLGRMMVAEMEAVGVDKLTEKQKEAVKKEYDDLQKAKDEFNAYMEKREAEFNAKKAEAEFNKTKATAKKTKKTHEDFVSERKSLKEELAAARKEHEDWLKEQGIKKSGFGSLTGKEAKVIAKIIKSYADEGITKLQEVVEKVFEDIKGVIPNISENDIRDVIAGKYIDKKQTRNQLVATLRDLKTEQNLINKLQELESGEEPVSEKKKIQRNREITELRKQIKEHDLTKLANRKSNIKSQIEKIQDQINKGDFAPPEKKEPIRLDAEGHKLRDKLIKLQQQRDARMMLLQRQKETGREMAMRLVAEVFNIPRTLMTIGDFSGLLRQNLFFSAGHPLMTAKATPDMFKSFVKPEVYDRWFADLKETPRYSDIKESGLAIADALSHDLSKREEAFMSSLAEKIPLGVGKIVKGSERSYTMLLNKMRVDVFNYLADQMEARGLTMEKNPKQYKAMAEYINNATGRSDFGERLNRIAPILNATFFSPRLIASRINMLTYWAQPRFWKTLPREARIDYFRNWASLLAVGMTILGLAKLAGADVEDDPRSSDFGKIRDGNTRWDIWGGAQPYVRALTQMFTGERKSTRTGKIYELNGDDIFGETRGGVALDFFRNKLAPVPGAAVDVLSGRTGIGERIIYEWGGAGDKEISIDQYVKERLLPMTITGTEEAIKDRGWKALFDVGIPSTFGIGTQTYGSAPSSSSTKQSRIQNRQQRQNRQNQRQ